MDPKVKEALHRQVEKEPFAKMLGLSLIEADDGYAVVEMVCTEDMERWQKRWCSRSTTR